MIDVPIKPLILSIVEIWSAGDIIPGIKLSCHIRNENSFSVCIINSWLEISDNKGIRWAKGPLLHTSNSPSEPALIKSGAKGDAEIAFQLSIPTLRKIEELRKGEDLELAISSRILVSKVIDGPDEIFISVPFETRLNSENSTQFKYNIPKSKWIEIYNTFGLTQIELVEIDFSLGSNNPVFKRALDRLSDAKKAFMQCEYANVLLSCRKAQEAFVKDTNQKEDMKEAILAIEKLLGEGRKAEKLNNTIKQFADFLHLGRHELLPPIAINRRDAEFAIQVSSALLSYLMGPNK